MEKKQEPAHIRKEAEGPLVTERAGKFCFVPWVKRFDLSVGKYPQEKLEV